MRFANCALTALLLAAPVHAQERSDHFVSGNWQGQAYFSKSGEFTSCSMHARYRSGISLYFGLTRTARFRIGFWKPDWVLQNGSRHRVTLYVDKQRIFSGVAKVVPLGDSSIVLVDLPLSRAIFDRFRGGYVLHVDAPHGRMGFSLSGSSAALFKLVQCVTKRIKQLMRMKPGPPATSSNPFGGPTSRLPSRKSAPVPSSGSDRVRAVTLIANVLARAAVDRYEIVPVDDVPKRWRRSHALWRSGETLGVISQ